MAPMIPERVQCVLLVFLIRRGGVGNLLTTTGNCLLSLSLLLPFCCLGSAPSFLCISTDNAEPKIENEQLQAQLQVEGL